METEKNGWVGLESRPQLHSTHVHEPTGGHLQEDAAQRPDVSPLVIAGPVKEFSAYMTHHKNSTNSHHRHYLL